MATVTLKAAGDVFHAVLAGPRVRPLARPAAQSRFLERLGAAIATSDVALISWACLPQRAYLGLVGQAAAVRALVTRFVGAERDTELVAGKGPAFVADMLAFHHNAPVRAGLCDSAWGSSWSSHRAYIHLCPRPPYLSCTRGLALCGMADTIQGRKRFDEAVLLRGEGCAPRRLSRAESHSCEAAFERDDRRLPGRKIAAAPSRATTAVVRPPRVDTSAATSPAERAPALSPPRTAVRGETVPSRARARRAGTTAVGHSAVGAERAAPLLLLGPAIPVAQVLQLAAATLGTTVERLADRRGSDLTRLAHHASAWCWIAHLGGAPAEAARVLGVDLGRLQRDLAALEQQEDHVARRLGDCLAQDLARGGQRRPSLGVPRPTAGRDGSAAVATGAATTALSGEYTDVVATHPATALSDVLTAR